MTKVTGYAFYWFRSLPFCPSPKASSSQISWSILAYSRAAFAQVVAHCANMPDPPDAPQITKCPPGIARGSSVQQWQFGLNDPYGIADIYTARRLALGELRPCELALFELIVDHPGDMPQRELEVLLFTQMGASASQVHSAAQRLAKHGKISRKKVSRQWHYAKPGFSWRSAQRAATTESP